MAERHFEKRYSRFQLRFVREGAPDELQDDEDLVPGMDLKLMVLPHLMPERSRDTRFWRCCQDSDHQEVEERLRALQEPNIKDLRWSPLSSSLRDTHLEVVRLLLEAQADTEWRSLRSGKTALQDAAAYGQPHVVRLLLQAAADLHAVDAKGNTALHMVALAALSEGHLEVVRLLLDFGADKEKMNARGSRPLLRRGR